MLWLGVFMLIQVWRDYLAQQALGQVQVDVGPLAVAPGGRVECTLRFRPPRDLTVHRITATLQGTETLVVEQHDGEDTYEVDHEDVLHEASCTLAGARHVAAGEPVRVQGTLVIPAQAPHTFVARWQQIDWLVRVEVQLNGGLCWWYEQPLAVTPTPEKAPALSTTQRPLQGQQAGL